MGEGFSYDFDVAVQQVINIVNKNQWQDLLGMCRTWTVGFELDCYTVPSIQVFMCGFES